MGHARHVSACNVLITKVGDQIMIENKWKRWGLLTLIVVCGIILLPLLLVASLALLIPSVRQKVKLALVSW